MAISSSYKVENGSVYDYHSGLLNPPADGTTFRVSVDGQYGTDGSHVYHFGSLIDGADPATFCEIDFGRWGTGYSLDARHVYAGNQLLEGADPRTFVILDRDGVFAKDSQHVFESGALLPGADPVTFTTWVDANGVLTDYPVAKDKDRVYGVEVAGVDPATFMPLHNADSHTNGNTGYYLDKNRVYYNVDSENAGFEIVAGADPSTFKVVNTQSGYDAEDKDHYYWQENVVGNR